ncbi:DciA family protein [Psychrobacter sp. HD31]|uniref:DciA family protein n=1 Tax=Psychrobacter sp. HD31 TaxID=3112003 RepID=UPI003DA3BCE7
MSQQSDLTQHNFTNQFGSLVDKQREAGCRLPNNISTHLQKLQLATNEFKTVLYDALAGLPKDIVKNCQVVKFTSTELTVSVTSITVANHMRYMQSQYLNELQTQSVLFQDLLTLKIIVTNLPDLTK